MNNIRHFLDGMCCCEGSADPCKGSIMLISNSVFSFWGATRVAVQTSITDRLLALMQRLRSSTRTSQLLNKPKGHLLMKVVVRKDPAAPDDGGSSDHCPPYLNVGLQNHQSYKPSGVFLFFSSVHVKQKQCTDRLSMTTTYANTH